MSTAPEVRQKQLTKTRTSGYGQALCSKPFACAAPTSTKTPPPPLYCRLTCSATVKGAVCTSLNSTPPVPHPS
jgi:hypothetical protein